VEEARAEVEAVRAAAMREGARGKSRTGGGEGGGGAGGGGGGGGGGGSGSGGSGCGGAGGLPLAKPSRAALLADLLSRDAVLGALPAVVFPSGHARTAADLAKAEAAAGGGVPPKK